MILKNDWKHPCPISLDDCQRIFWNKVTSLFDKKSCREIALSVRTFQSGINFIAFAHLGSNN